MSGYAGDPPPISILSADLLGTIFYELIKVENTLPAPASVEMLRDLIRLHGSLSIREILPYHSVTISHVCRLWRDVALGMGKLWSKVPINRRETALHYLARSKQSPLDLFYIREEGTSVCDFGWLIPYSPRFRGIIISRPSTKEIEVLMGEIPDELPLLETIVVSQNILGWAVLNTDHLRDLDWKFRAPALRFLTLSCNVNVKLNHLLSFLREAPLLQSVNLRDICPMSDPLVPELDLRVVDLRHVQDWNLERIFRVFDLLNRLDIYPHSFSLLENFLNSHPPPAPATKEQLARTLTKHTRLSITVFNRVTIQSSTSSASCEISHPHSSNAFLPLFLEHFGAIIPWSSLTYLELSTKGDGLNIPWDNLTPVWSPIFSSLVSVEAIRISSPGFQHLSVILQELCKGSLGSIKCPRLSTLQLQHFDFSQVDFDRASPEPLSRSLLDFTSWRKDLGLPLQSLMLLSCDSVRGEILEDLKLNVGIVDIRD